MNARPWVLGHRGTRRGAPENSLLAFSRALDQGADGVELDVRLCASGEVIVLHDPDLARVAGVALLAAEAPLSTLLACELGEGERVPTLDQALDLVLGRSGRVNVELKSDVPDARALCDAVAERIAARPESERSRLLFSSFSAEQCELLARALPRAAIGFLFARTPKPPPPCASAVHPEHTLADPASIAAWHARGLRVHAWTVNDAGRARALARAGVDAIITDDVPLVLGALAARGS